jgi:hypothetical protein
LSGHFLQFLGQSLIGIAVKQSRRGVVIPVDDLDGDHADHTEMQAAIIRIDARVRRLKSDLKRFGENFPTRRVDAIVIDDLPPDAPELVLANKLAAYDALVADTVNKAGPSCCPR